MPGWYVHMEAAHETAERLRAGAVPSGFPIGIGEAQDLGAACHTWRNYLALGSLGPDLFYLLPDFADTKGCVIRQIVQWATDVWAEIDREFVSKWDKWIGPISTNSSQLAAQLTGGLSNQLAQVLNELTSAVMSAFQGLLAKMGDWFGILTSGVPQGYGNNGFYWSDVFHYRRTYQFPFVLFQQARAARDTASTDDERNDADARMAFAVGWMTHCATDVTGHAFTNAKAGGPYRDHWQRHHLVENHIDSQNYSAINSGACYGEYGTSALHFWVAFRRRGDGPYGGRDDAPAYDYFTGFPAYDTADGPTPAAKRKALFNLDSGSLPVHLTDALLDAMAEVHPDGPKILTQDPQYSATDSGGQPDGRPNADAMAQMWDLVYTYLKMTGSDGLSPTRPKPPEVFTDHSFPTPPGGGGHGVDDDPARGADVGDDDSFSLLDLLLALFAWAVYLAEVVIWLATILPSLIIDVTTFPAREVIYYGLVVPAWNLFMLARRALVMSGFLMPKPEEIDPGLSTLGGAEFKPSEWVAPWRYPLKNQAAQWVPQEGPPAHVGPWIAGQRSTVLLGGTTGDDNARARLEKCASPQQTFDELQQLLPSNAHLGGPIDYSTYLVGRMVAERGQSEISVPDFNLDSDRGYAWHCWDWDRHHLGRDPAKPMARGAWECVPDHIATAQSDFSYAQPCTPPQFFYADHDNRARSTAQATCSTASGTTPAATSRPTTWPAP